MEAFDKVEELLLAEGYSKEEIPAIMVSLIEQGFDPTAVFLGGIANMLDLLPKKKTTPKVQPPKVTTPPQTGGLLGTRSVPTMTDLGAAPKPQFGPGSTNTGQSFPKPPRVTRDAGAFARQRLMVKPPAAVPSLFGRLKNVRGGPLSTAVNLATGAALDKYVVQPVAKAGGDALARGLLDVTGQGNRARQIMPSLYGKSGPDLTPEIKAGIQSREPRGMSNIPPEEGPVNNPNFGKKPAPVKPAPATKLSAAAKDFDKAFAAAREKGLKTFPWRGKTYNTKLKGE